MTRYQVEPTDAQVAETAEAVLALRIAGRTYRQIADEMTGRGCPMSKDTAYRRVCWALQQILAPGVSELRKLEAERLDVALRALEPAMLAGNLQAVQAWLRVSESRRRLLGLDIPVQQEVDLTGTVTVKSEQAEELDALVAEMERRAAEEMPGQPAG